MVALGELVQIDRRVATPVEARTLPYVGLDDIEKETGGFGTGFAPKPETLLASKFRFTRRHVLYGKLRPYLNKVALPDFEGVCTTEVLPLLPRDEALDRRYLYYKLRTPEFVAWASDNVQGANLPRLSPGQLADFELGELPPLPEQQRIARILDQADRLRRLRRYALALSDTFLPATFRQMFGDFRSGESAFALTELEDVAEIVSGVTKGQRFGDRATVEVPYLRVANVQDGYLDLSEIKTITALATEAIQLRLQAGDVLMTEGGDYDKLGRGAIWTADIPECIHQNHIFRVRLKQDRVLPTFFAAFLRSEAAKEYYLSCSKQTTNLASINMTQLRATPVPLPPVALQQRFAALVESHERLRATQREALRQADHLFQSLLQRAFTDGL